MLVTSHQFLDQYPIAPSSRKLILGTIHPHWVERFHLPFFYGNVLSLWNILSDAFPDELPRPITLEKILYFLQQRHLAVSDTIRVCQRKKDSALDEDLIPMVLNHSLLASISNSNIEEIFFTSGFQTTNAFKLFYVDLLGQKITPALQKSRSIWLDSTFFGRKIKLTVLYSPSGAANIGFSQTDFYQQHKHLFQHTKRPVYEAKVLYYRQQFSHEEKY